jgi:poly(3-hydroxybutyrate) depolymerase
MTMSNGGRTSTTVACRTNAIPPAAAPFATGIARVIA